MAQAPRPTRSTHSEAALTEANYRAYRGQAAVILERAGARTDYEVLEAPRSRTVPLSQQVADGYSRRSSLETNQMIESECGRIESIWTKNNELFSMAAKEGMDPETEYFGRVAAAEKQELELEDFAHEMVAVERDTGFVPEREVLERMARLDRRRNLGHSEERDDRGRASQRESVFDRAGYDLSGKLEQIERTDRMRNPKGPADRLRNAGTRLRDAIDGSGTLHPTQQRASMLREPDQPIGTKATQAIQRDIDSAMTPGAAVTEMDRFAEQSTSSTQLREIGIDRARAMREHGVDSPADLPATAPRRSSRGGLTRGTSPASRLSGTGTTPERDHGPSSPEID